MGSQQVFTGKSTTLRVMFPDPPSTSSRGEGEGNLKMREKERKMLKERRKKCFFPNSYDFRDNEKKGRHNKCLESKKDCF